MCIIRVRWHGVADVTGDIINITHQLAMARWTKQQWWMLHLRMIGICESAVGDEGSC
jgi:hypothetical protein